MISSTSSSDPRGLDVAGLSRRTGFHAETLKRWARIGRIPGRNYGGGVGWRFDPDAVLAALARRFSNAAERESLRFGFSNQERERR